MKQVNALFDDVLKVGPKAFVESWLSEAMQSGDSTSIAKTAPQVSTITVRDGVGGEFDRAT